MGSINPADHFTVLMHHELRASGLVGNLCAIALRLDGVPDAHQIRQRCTQFAAQFPQSTARLRRQGRQFHWQDTDRPIPVESHRWQADVPGDRDAVLTRLLNEHPPQDDIPPFSLHLLNGGDESLLVLRWFHPAFDAKGAELVLHHLFGEPTESKAPAVPVLENLIAKWSLWQKIKLGFKAKRMVDRLDRYSSILPSGVSEQAPGFAFRLANINRMQSDEILANARREVGLMGISQYFIGCMMRALSQVGCGVDGDAFCVPYAMNLRRRKALLPIFGNQVSFLFAQAPKALVAERESLFRHLLEQSKAAVRDELDKAMLPLLQAGSWLSLKKLGQIVRFNAKGRERSSFWFSFTGEMEPAIASIAGCEVVGIHQFTPVTAPPSLGLLVGQYRGELTLSLNFIPTHFDDDWLDRLQRIFIAELLGEGQ